MFLSVFDFYSNLFPKSGLGHNLLNVKRNNIVDIMVAAGGIYLHV
jgi:hypothetical protein